MKRICSAVVCTALFFSLFFNIRADAKNLFSLVDLTGKTVIIHTNDIHGRVQYGVNDSLGFSAVGALKEACIKAGAKTIVLDCGDLIRGTPFALYDKGASIIKMMNVIGYDAMIPGNHDYEYGVNYLKELSANMNFPVLASNVLFLSNHQYLFESQVVIERNGLTYGIFGLETPATMTINREENVRGIQVVDPILMAKLEVSLLKAKKVDIIIAISHLGIKFKEDPNCVDLLSQVDGIDLLIDGHSHSSLDACIAANPSQETLYVSAGQYLNQIGVVVVEPDGSMNAYSLGKEELKSLGICYPYITEYNKEAIQKLEEIIKKVEDEL